MGKESSEHRGRNNIAVRRRAATAATQCYDWERRKPLRLLPGTVPVTIRDFFKTLPTENNPMSDELKGGKLAQKAAILCHDAKFRLWLDRRRTAKFKIDFPDGTHTEQDAREFILQACGIESRRELDHNQVAAKQFYYVLHHFNKFLRRLNQS